MMRTTFFILILLSFGLGAYAQDRIIMKDGKELNGKVTEVGTKEISYRMSGSTDGPVFKCDKQAVKQIIFSSGEVWTNEEKASGVKAIKENFDSMRAENKKLVLVNDSTAHHIISFQVGAPQFDIDRHLRFKVQGGISYEYQPKGNAWGFRVMPYYTVEDGSNTPVPLSNGSISIALSPRYYPKNWRSSQYYIGIEGSVGTYIPDDTRDTYYNTTTRMQEDFKWVSAISSWNVVTGGHVIFPNGFNLNAEIGFGIRYEYYSINDEVPEYAFPKFGIERSASDVYFTCFGRLGIGGRIRKKK